MCVYVSVYACGLMCQGIYMEVTGQFGGVNYFLPPCESQRLKLFLLSYLICVNILKILCIIIE